MTEINKNYLDKHFEIIAEKISRFEKTLDLRTKDFDEIIKESLDSNYNVVKMIQEEVGKQNQKIESLQTHLNATSKNIAGTIGQAVQESLGDSRDILAKVSDVVEKQEAKITSAAASIEKVGKEIDFETKQLDKHSKEALGRNYEILKEVYQSQEAQTKTITSINEKLEQTAKDVDYRLRQSENNIKNTIEDTNKILKMLQEDVYNLKKSADVLSNNVQMIQRNIQFQVQEMAENIKVSNSRFDLLHNDIAHLAEPFSRVDEHIEQLNQKIRSQRTFFFVTMAVIILVMVGTSFLFDRNNQARFLDIQQAYQQFYSVNQAGNVEVSKNLQESAVQFSDTSKQESERIIKEFEKKLESLNRNYLDRIKTVNDRIKTVNKRMTDTVKEENRKLLSILGDQNEHQMRVIERLLQQERTAIPEPEESSP
jgi:hypothetical protein